MIEIKKIKNKKKCADKVLAYMIVETDKFGQTRVCNLIEGM